MLKSRGVGFGRCRLLLRFCGRLLRFRSGVVVGDLNANLSSILPSAGELGPLVALATARHDDVSQADPGLPYEIGLLIVIKDGDLQLVVIQRVMNGKSEFLVPVIRQDTVSPSAQLMIGKRGGAGQE